MPRSIEKRREWHRRRYAANKERLTQLKDVPCLDCGGRFPPCVMDFDHRPDELKLFELSENAQRSWASLEAEAAKCDIVCANCHRIRTHITRSDMANTNEDAGDLAITTGTVQPDSSLEAASIAAGIPAASLDIYYDDDSAQKHAHEHSYGGSQTP